MSSVGKDDGVETGGDEHGVSATGGSGGLSRRNHEALQNRVETPHTRVAVEDATNHPRRPAKEKKQVSVQRDLPAPPPT